MQFKLSDKNSHSNCSHKLDVTGEGLPSRCMDSKHHKYWGAGLHCAVVCSADAICPPAYPISLFGALLISGPDHYLVQFCFSSHQPLSPFLIGH